MAAETARTCMCGSSARSWFPSSFSSPSTMITQCLLRTGPAPKTASASVAAVPKQRRRQGPPVPLRPPGFKELRPVETLEDIDDAKIDAQEEVVSTSAGSATDLGAPADLATEQGSEASSSDLSGGVASERPQSPGPVSDAEPAVEKVEPQKPNFAGKWNLVRTEGNLDKFLTDMGQSWLIRNGAKALKYGVGRVVVECQQDGDGFTFTKVLCDPRNLSKSKVHIVPGQGTVRFLDDIGQLSSTSRWSDDLGSLRFDAKLVSSGLPVTLLMYHNEAGNFVEEMISCKGTVAKYIFDRKA